MDGGYMERGEWRGEWGERGIDCEGNGERALERWEWTERNGERGKWRERNGEEGKGMRKTVGRCKRKPKGGKGGGGTEKESQ